MIWPSRLRNVGALALAWMTVKSGSPTTNSAPYGWIEPGSWICSRSQFERSACPKAGIGNGREAK